jgi:hypothetical protein
LVLSAPETGEAKLKQIIATIQAIFFTTAPPSSFYADSLEYFLFFFAPICQSFSTPWHR